MLQHKLTKICDKYTEEKLHLKRILLLNILRMNAQMGLEIYTFGKQLNHL